MAYELIQKQAFLNDLVLLEKSDQKKVPHATVLIRRDPFGPSCKKILKHQYKNLYRHRIGNHRLCYAVGTGCVALLAVGPRKEVYERFHGDPSGAVQLDCDLKSADLRTIPTAVEDAIPASLPDGSDTSAPRPDEGLTSGSRSRELLQGLLELWQVPDEHHESVLSCAGPEDLLELDLPEEVLDKLLHWHQPPNVEQIVDQPSYELPSAEDLEHYAEGTLSGFLLRLDPEQKKAVDRGSAGPLLVRGGPGTGKSIAALYRIRNLFTPGAQQELFEGEPPKVLFVTFTRALTNASSQLLDVLLGDQAAEHVDVKTLDATAAELTRDSDTPGRLMQAQMKEAVVEALGQVRFPGKSAERQAAEKVIERLEPDYLVDEFDWVIEGQAMGSVTDYLEARRAGRGIGLDERARRAVWTVYEAWKGMLKSKGGLTFTQAQRQALDAALAQPTDEKYDVVVLDEAQDLKPVGIRLAMAMAKSARGFYMTADAGQSIYGRGFTWKAVSDELQLRGRSFVLRRNYRSTQQIQDAANSFLRVTGLEEADQEADAVKTGPKPVCCECADGEAAYIGETLQRWSRELRLPVWLAAVLVRSRREGERLVEGLSTQGLPVEWVASKDLDIEAKFIKVMTAHAAKGLEFPMVVVAGLRRNLFPMFRRRSQDREDYAEVLNQERRLFHVALSRAMRRLMVTFPAHAPSEFIGNLATDLWEWPEEGAE